MAVSWLDPNDIETLVSALAAGTAWADAKALLPTDKVDDTFLDTQETALTAIAAHRASEACVGTDARFALAAAAVTPTFTSITPATGDAGGGELCTIVGTGFQPGATVTIGGHEQKIISVNPTTIVLETVAHAATANMDIVITNPNETTVTESAGFEFTAAATPTFTSITPTTGHVRGGGLAKIVGTNFKRGVKVQFGTTQAYVEYMTATAINVRIPAHAAGELELVITNLSGNHVHAAAAFTYS